MKIFSTILGKAFAKSPFTPLYHHAKLMEISGKIICDIFDAFLSRSYQEMEKGIAELIKVEEEGDKLKEEVRARTGESILLPIERSDLISLLREQEAILDANKHIALLFRLEQRELIPKNIGEIFHQIVDKNREISSLLYQGISELRVLIESTFGRKEIAELKKVTQRIDEIEKEIDHLRYTYFEALFGLKDPKSLTVFYITNLAKFLCEISDHADNAGEVLELITAKRGR